jgi:hypothetical protein
MVKLDKDVHFQLKVILFKYDLSIQEILEAFVEDLILEQPRAMSFLSDLVKTKVKRRLEPIRYDPKDRSVPDFDTDALYDLIAEREKKNDDD